VGIFFMIVLAFTEAGIPALLKPVLDGTFVEKNHLYMAWAPLAIIGLFFVRGIAGFINKLAMTEVSTRVVFDLRRDMFNKMLAMPTAYYDSHPTGNLLSKITYDANQVTSAATKVLTVLVKDSLTAIALIAYVFWLDWQLAMLVFILIPIVAVVATLIGRRMRRLSRLQQAAQGDMTRTLEESLRGNKAVKMFGGQTFEASRFHQISNWVRRLRMKGAVAESLSVPIVEFVGAILMAMVIYIGTSRAESDQLSVGGFVAFFAALGLLFSPIKRLTKVNEPLQRGLAAAESVFGLLDAEKPERDSGSGIWPTPRGEIDFLNVSFSYPGAERKALDNVSFSLEAGSTVALVGRSGSGKSTLVSLVPRLYNPGSGTIKIDGIDTQDLPLKELRKNIALVSQDIFLFDDDIATNISYGTDPEPDIAAIKRAAKAAYADEFIAGLPDGYKTKVGENGVRLSGGQRQRMAIARALLRDAHILILDEATSALDNESEKYVQAALESLRKGRTTLIIAHRLSTVEHADRILVMEEGRVVEDGSHLALIQQNGRYADLYRRHFED
jgi:subfamily B ATP-binding cassette protein MsbA